MSLSFKSLTTWIVALTSSVLALQAIYVALYGGWDITYGRSWILCGAVVVALLGNPLAQRVQGSRHSVIRNMPVWLLWGIDLILIAIYVYGTLKFIEIQILIEETIFEYDPNDITIAFAAVIVLLEATRRLFGLPIVIIAAFGILYCLYGEVLPGFLNHSGFGLNRSMQTIWYSFQGVFGLPMGVVLQVVLIFVVFGVILESTGASDALIRASVALTGKTRGGPAHSAVVASAVFGSMSGSVTANVVGTGSFTIPMIKRRGFSGPMAGGIEAAASTGGQIVPPVMGAAAFLMADLTGEAYTTICIAALIPALFYYGSLFASISIQAGADGIEPLPESERPPLNRKDLLACLMFIIPIATIVFVLVMGRSPALAGFWAIVAAVILGLFNKKNRENPAIIWTALVKAGRSCAWIIVAVGCIGVIIGVLNLTGLLSAITPPVAIGAFAAAPIANAHPFTTAVYAVRIALVGFIIPFIFIYEPSLLLVGETFDAMSFVRVAICLSLAIWLINTALIGYERQGLGVPERILRGLAGAGLLIQIPTLQIAFLVIGLSLITFGTIRYRRKLQN